MAREHRDSRNKVYFSQQIPRRLRIFTIEILALQKLYPRCKTLMMLEKSFYTALFGMTEVFFPRIFFLYFH